MMDDQTKSNYFISFPPKIIHLSKVMYDLGIYKTGKEIISKIENRKWNYI